MTFSAAVGKQAVLAEGLQKEHELIPCGAQNSVQGACLPPRDLWAASQAAKETPLPWHLSQVGQRKVKNLYCNAMFCL